MAIALVLVQGLIACGGSSDDATATSTPDTGADTASDAVESPVTEDSGSDSSSAGDLDCDALRESFGAMSVPLQFLAQLRDADQWDLLATGVVAFDPDEFQSEVDGLRPLESLPDNGADVAEGLDLYSEAASLVAEAQQSSDPATSEAATSLATLNDDVQTFLLYQADISTALDEAGC